MNLKKFSSCMIVFMLVSMGFGMMSSHNAQAAFIQPLSNTGLPSTFIAYDTAWNDAGTMAVVVGHDGTSSLTNAYAYFPNNDTYWPIDNGGWNDQGLHAVDYFSQPIYDWPNVLLVDADWIGNDLITFYSNAFNGINAYVDIWDVWDNPSIDQGKPTAADMAKYDLVVWIPSRYMAGYMGLGGDALNPTDMQEISIYMNGGGNFFLSNVDFTSYYWNTFSSGGFAYDYLGANGYGSMSYEYYARSMAGDAVFDGLGTVSQDWWAYGWGGSQPGQTDNLWAKPGAVQCFQGLDNSQTMVSDTGIRYDSGTFKSIYFAFPLETLPVYYAADIMQMTLDWINAPAQDQANEEFGSGSWIDVGMSIGNPWAQSFVPSQGSISKVEFYIYSMSSSSDYFEIQIRPDAGGIPSTGYLTYGFISSGSIPLSPAWVSCDFGSGTTLTIGQTYWIVCTRFGFTVQQNWMADYSMSYPQGSAMYDMGGSVWSGPQTYDWLFRTYPQVGSGTPMSVTLYPSKDTAIYEEEYTRGNGGGEYLLAGVNYGWYRMRTLMEFNIAADIPRYSTINNVDLALYCSHTYDSNTYNMDLHPVTTEWGEAGSNAPDSWEEWGAPTTLTGDATWDYTYYDTAWWSGSGGSDYNPVSATTPVGSEDMTYYWSSGSMVNDVQGWLDYPNMNHGWVLRGDEGMTGTVKWFNSKENGVDSSYWPRLMISYTEPTIVGYEDVFWIAGDTQGANPPATCYKFVPTDKMELQPMNTMSDYSYTQLYAIAVDDIGNPLCGGQMADYVYYYDGEAWMTLMSGNFDQYDVTGIDFNPNDRRFYIIGQASPDPTAIFYSDPVPFEAGTSKCYVFNGFTGTAGMMNSIAWNENLNYGLVAEQTRLLKVWPYGYYGNGSIRYETVAELAQYNFQDVSWDTDGWNEAAIVGMYSTSKMYWRYYNSNPQLIEGYNGLAGSYYTCAFKPPSSPKWVLIPSGGGSIRVNAAEKDQSTEIVISSEFPHIFNMGMWKQSDLARLSTLGTQVEADSTYTFYIEGNYTRSGIDQWDTSLGIWLQVWYDAGFVFTNSDPADMSWSSKVLRTRQFNVSYNPATGTASILYPNPVVPATPEFVLHSYWEDPVTYGADGNTYHLYLNVTFGEQTYMAPGDGMFDGPTATPWRKDLALDDAWSWDIKAILYDTGVPEAFNTSYEEFGVERFASISVSGSPTGSIPPGAQAVLATPSSITYSTNAMYKLNVSIPDLLKDGNPGIDIPATYVDVMNIHSDAEATYSDIWGWTAFTASGDHLCIWGQELGTYVAPVGNGTVSAGPSYTDYTAADLGQAFEVTQVSWRVEVPAGRPEGVYRATITITLWS